MKVLYLDATAGIAGDMTVATLLELGLPVEYLQKELDKLGLPDNSFQLACQQVQRQGMTGLQFIVNITKQDHHHHHRSYADIQQMIASSSLNNNSKQMAQKIFLKLAEAEAVAHQVVVDEVHFHEVGAVDSIVDIVGTAIGLDWLGVEQLYCSPIPLGGGFVETAHGRLPVPAPATALLMKGLLLHSNCGIGERVTPTGAAILAALAKPVSAMPAMQLDRLGNGAGSKDFDDCPNILRGLLGDLADVQDDQVLELACNLDDVTPEVIGYTVQRLFEAGALDVWTVPIMMKKQRPATMLSILCQYGDRQLLSEILMEETGTLGIRVRPVERILQRRDIQVQETAWGEVRYKQSDHGIKPEFEDCSRIAQKQGLPLRQVQQQLMKGFGE